MPKPIPEKAPTAFGQQFRQWLQLQRLYFCGLSDFFGIGVAFFLDGILLLSLFFKPGAHVAVPGNGLGNQRCELRRFPVNRGVVQQLDRSGLNALVARERFDEFLRVERSFVAAVCFDKFDGLVGNSCS